MKRIMYPGWGFLRQNGTHTSLTCSSVNFTLREICFSFGPNNAGVTPSLKLAELVGKRWSLGEKERESFCSRNRMADLVC